MKNNVKLTVAGASGRMGTRIIALAKDDSRFQVVAGVERPQAGGFAKFTADGRAPLVYDIREVLSKTDVVIDFTSPEGVKRNAAEVARARRGLVVGTTGLPDSVRKQLVRESKRIPIVFSPNMSLGVNVLFKLVAEAARTLAGYDLEIIEAHHNLKKDAPSGTAMKLAEVAAEASRRSAKDFVYGRKGMVGARTKKEIGMSVIRAGDIVGDHTVLLGGPGERIELRHQAHSRDAFAAGALTAAAWVHKRRPGLYTMQDVLGIK